MAAHAAFGMLAGVDRPALAATIPTTRSVRRCCSTSAPASSAGRSTSCSSRSWAACLCAGGARHRDAARRAAVDRRGGDQGQRADARGAPAAESVAALVHRQRRGARRLQRPRRRDRLRRLHRQHRAEDQRGAGRSDRRLLVSSTSEARCRSALAFRARRLLEYGGAPLLGRQRRRRRRSRPVERQTPCATRVVMAHRFASDALHRARAGRTSPPCAVPQR